MASKNISGELEVEIVNSTLLNEMSNSLFLESFSVHLYFSKCTLYSCLGTVNIRDTN